MSGHDATPHRVTKSENEDVRNQVQSTKFLPHNCCIQHDRNVRRGDLRFLKKSIDGSSFHASL